MPNLWGDVNFLFPAVCTTCLVLATTTSHCYTLHTLHVHTLPRSPTNTPPLCAPNWHSPFHFVPQKHNHTSTLCPKPTTTLCPEYTNTLPRRAPNTQTHNHFVPQTHDHTTTLCPRHTITPPLCALNCHRLGSLRSMRWPSLPHFPYSRVKALPEIQESHLSRGTVEVYMLRILLSICKEGWEKHNRSF